MTAFTKDRELSGSNALLAVGAGAGFGLLLCVAIIWSAFWSGLGLSVLWGWFVAPLFGLPALTIGQAYGLALVASALRGTKHTKTEDDFGVVIAKALLAAPISCGMLLFVGWCLKAWA